MNSFRSVYGALEFEIMRQTALARDGVRIVQETREHEALAFGVSPRGAIALRRAAQARALLDGRDFCIPEDIREPAVDVLAHRVLVDPRAGRARGGEETTWIVCEILEQVAVPL